MLRYWGRGLWYMNLAWVGGDTIQCKTMPLARVGLKRDEEAGMWTQRRRRLCGDGYLPRAVSVGGDTAKPRRGGDGEWNVLSLCSSPGNHRKARKTTPAVHTCTYMPASWHTEQGWEGEREDLNRQMEEPSIIETWKLFHEVTCSQVCSLNELTK